MSAEVRLVMTLPQADALLIMCTAAEAGDLGELLGDGYKVRSALLVIDELRRVLSVAERKEDARRKARARTGRRTDGRQAGG
jgi:hypothetical protein